VAHLAASITGISYSFTAHAKDIFHADVIEKDFSKKLEFSKIAITISDFNYTYIKQKYGKSARQLQRVYNGLPLNDFIYKSPEKRLRTVISVSRLVTKKGLSFLIDACFILQKKGVKFQCNIIGDGPLKSQLQAQISHHNLEKTVIMTGPKTQQEVKQLVQNSAIFAAPCIVADDGNRDGLPTVLLEAMALGTPCISTKVTGIPEIIRNNITGLLINEKDAVQLATAIERLFNNEDLGIALSKNARDLIEHEFDIDKNTSKLRRIMMIDKNIIKTQKDNHYLDNKPQEHCI